MTDFIGEWIDETQDGFENGMSDVVQFFRENVAILIGAGIGPEMAPMFAGAGTDTIMQHVTKLYKVYREK